MSDERDETPAGEPRHEAYARALGGVDPRWDAAHTERALASLHRARARRRAGTVLVGVLLLTSGTALGAWRLTPDDAPTLGSTEVVPAARVVRLADGSRIVPDDGAHVVVEHVTSTRIAVRVDHGAADVEVVPGLPRRFEVRAGPVTVRVLGTAFRIERLDETRAHVAVERGHVDVAWAGGHAELVDGDEGIFPTLDASVGERTAGAIEPEAIEGPPSAGEPASSEPEAIAPTVRRDPTVRPAIAERGTGWRDLAHASRYDEAYAALGAPAERARSVTDAVEDLLLAADVARLSGHPAEALPWLEAVERDHASDPRAALAAFTRGRILMELGRAGDAARQLERVVAMEPAGSLAEDALARAALAHAAAGDAARATALAERYLAAHPAGRWSQRLRDLGLGGAPIP